MKVLRKLLKKLILITLNIHLKLGSLQYQNIHIDRLRKHKNNFNLLEVDDQNNLSEYSPSPEDDLINEQKLVSLKIKIQLLKPLYRKAIELRYLNDLSHKEIAKELNQPVNNVKVRVLRAKKC